MDTLRDLLRTRQEYLLQLLKETKEALLEVPEGGLRVSVNQGKNLITTFETRKHPLTITAIQGIIDRFFHNT